MWIKCDCSGTFELFRSKCIPTRITGVCSDCGIRVEGETFKEGE